MDVCKNLLEVFWGEVDAELPCGQYMLNMRDDWPGDFKRKYKKSFFSAGSELLLTRNEIQNRYIDITAKIGLVEKSGQSLRQFLWREKGKGVSRWWYHLLACRNDPTDLSYIYFQDVVLIDRLGERLGVNELRLYDAPPEIATILASKWKLTSLNQSKYGKSMLALGVVGIASRANYLKNFIMQKLALNSYNIRSQKSFDVAFFSFYDWSFRVTETNRTEDKYYGTVPDLLSSKGVLVKHVAWFDPYAEDKKRKQGLRDILLPAMQSGDIVFLQSALTIIDLLKEILNFKLFFGMLLYNSQVRRALFLGGMDFFPAFKKSLFYRCLDASTPHLKLVELSTKRTFDSYQVKLGVTFLETYPFSRALASGIRTSEAGGSILACQHSPKSSESLFFRHSKHYEICNQFDGQKVPIADYFCAMGLSGADLAEKNGFEKQNIILTGSPRYDKVSKIHLREKKTDYSDIRILYAASGDVHAETRALEFLCRAFERLEKIDNFSITIRGHPFYPVDHSQITNGVVEQFKVSKQSLQDDLKQTDLVLFSNSTVGDEAVISGVSAWQIVTECLCYSGLLHSKSVPVFYSENELSQALEELIKNKSLSKPTFKEREYVELNSFFCLDGMASERVANFITKLLA